MTTGEFKDVAKGISAILSTLAIIGGAAWAYWKFVIQKERERRAEFDLTGDFVGKQNGKWVIEVSARLANRGKVRHLMENATLNIRYLTADDPILESPQDGHFRQVTFPHSIERRTIWTDSYIESRVGISK
jgi:hypothetical protein